MQNLNINLFINPKCELVAVDNTIHHNLHYGDNQYLDDIQNHVSVEFLTDHVEDIVSDSVRIKKQRHARREFVDGNISVFHFPFDGLFTYYKYLLPTVEHLLKTDEEGDYYKSADQTFFYDGNIYLAKDDYDTLDDLLANAQKLNSLTDIWDVQGTQTFSFQKMIFSVCKLQKCLVYLQRKSLDLQSDCTCIKSENNSLKNIRDFLFSSLFVFDYLKDIENYEEAQRLLENISDCTETICSDFKLDCNCGKTIRKTV